MNNITLFDTILKYFLIQNKNNSFSFADLEESIVNFGDNTTLNLYKYIIEKIDLDFKYSDERKEKYDIKETYSRTLLTSIGPLNLSLTRYKDKDTGKSYYYTREILNMIPYQRLTLTAEYKIVKYAMEFNMAQAGRLAIRNHEVSRSLVAKIVKNLKGSLHEKPPEKKKFIKVIYVEVDEVHANLQNKNKQKGEPSKNKICLCMYVHEGYVNENSKRKVKKNPHYFSSAELSYEELYEVVYEYIDSHYILNKEVTIFISGDGGRGIKTYNSAFPTAIYVSDHFHYKKHMKTIFKNQNNIIKFADEYIRNNNIEAFKELIKIQIQKYPEQKKPILMIQKLFLSNIEGIKNQNHPLYKAHCSMEGTISSKYARYITSSPYAFSIQGLANKLKLLTLKANKHELTFDDYIMLKYSSDEQKEIVDKIKKLVNIKCSINLYDKPRETYIPTAPKFKLDDISLEDYKNNLIKSRNQFPLLY